MVEAANPEFASYVAKVASETPTADLPHVIADLERAKAIAWARLTVPMPPQQDHDELVDVRAAAERLGVSRDFLYRHAREYSFVRRQGRKLLFSALEIDRYIRQPRS